jgi:hypothetical protein
MDDLPVPKPTPTPTPKPRSTSDREQGAKTWKTEVRARALFWLEYKPIELARLRVAYREGKLEPEHVELPPLRARASDLDRRVARFVALCFGLRAADGDWPALMPLERRVVAHMIGDSEEEGRQVGRSLGRLIRWRIFERGEPWRSQGRTGDGVKREVLTLRLPTGDVGDASRKPSAAVVPHELVEGDQGVVVDDAAAARGIDLPSVAMRDSTLTGNGELATGGGGGETH